MRYYSWSVNNAGELTLLTGGIAQLQNQSLVRLIADGRLLEPLKASVKGQLHYLAFHNGWGGFYPLLKFDGLSVNGGDYLIYEGGLTIRHYDANYNLMNEYQGEGVEIQIGGEIAGVDVHYALTEDSDIEPFATIFQDAEIFEIERKKNGESV